MTQYVVGPFAQPEQRSNFTGQLRSTGCTDFAMATSVELDLAAAGGGGQVQDSPTTESARQGAGVGLIVGVTAAALAVLLLTLGLYQRRRRRKAQLMSSGATLSKGDDLPFSGYDPNDYASEIGIQTAVEVSTLGDPIPIGVATWAGDGSTHDTISLDYDFQKAYHQTALSEVSGSQQGDQPSPRKLWRWWRPPACWGWCWNRARTASPP